MMKIHSLARKVSSIIQQMSVSLSLSLSSSVSFQRGPIAHLAFPQLLSALQPIIVIVSQLHKVKRRPRGSPTCSRWLKQRSRCALPYPHHGTIDRGGLGGLTERSKKNNNAAVCDKDGSVSHSTSESVRYVNMCARHVTDPCLYLYSTLLQSSCRKLHFSVVSNHIILLYCSRTKKYNFKRYF